MLKNKKGEFGIIAILTLLFGTVIFASAVVLNATDNFNLTINESLSNLSLLNETVIDNLSINSSISTNLTTQNQSIISNDTTNLTIPLDNVSINQGINLTLNNTIINQTINITLSKKLKNLSEIVEKNRNKLNNETENYLKEIKDKKEVKDFIIKFKNSVDENKLVNVTLDKKIDKFKVTKIKGKVEDIEDLIEDAEIEFVELEQNVEVLGEIIPFNIKSVKADSVWNVSNGSGIKVAVLDTGISLHNDLSIAGGISFVDNNYFDSNSHGTSVAGVIAALLNNEGLVGTAPSVDLYSVKIMQSSTGDLSNAIAGIEWAINNSMDIVSMSFGFNSYSQIFKEVLQSAYNNNVLLVAASGNNGQDNILYPAKYDTVIAVGAIDENNNIASFSSYGFEQELVAPGVDINSTSLGNSYSLSSGTSLAAPHVAGVAALIKSFNKSLTNEQIRAKLRNDALDLGQAGKDDLFGYGLVQVNLNTSNFTLINLSYFYEVFNITDFGLPNITFTFWLNGTGTIDDVDFMLGYYLVNITYNNLTKKSRIYNVSENGSIFILATSIEFRDFFSTDGGTTSDGIAWINDNITVKVTTNIGTPQGECFYIGSARQFNSFDYCYFDNSTHQTQCESDPDIDCAITTCEVVGTSGIGTEKEIIDYTFATSNTSQGRVYTDCSNPGGSQETSSTKTFYIVDRKAARCSNSSNYNVSGWYGTNWVVIAQSTCSSGYKCVNSSNFTTESAYINPCISESTCTGTVQVITEDRNGNPMSNLLVSRDEVSNKTTNSVGVAEYNLSKTCGQSMEFKVYCSNSSTATLCGTKTPKLDVVNDYEGLLFDCSICSGSPDMQIDVDNVKASKTGSKVTVNISLVGNVTGTNINITFKVQGNDGLISKESSQLFNISSGNIFIFINQTITLNKNDDFLHIYIDPNNKVQESNEKNNYALVPLFKKELKVYFDIDTGYASVNNEIKDYIKLFVNEETNQINSDVTLCVGKKCSNFNALNKFALRNLYVWWKKQSYGFKKSQLVFNERPVGSKPYNAIIAGFLNATSIFELNNRTLSRQYIIAYGTDIDGDIAAVKKLISARDLFLNPSLLNEERVKVIDDFDLTGISVADLLRNPNNKPYYNQRGSDAFANVISRVLNNNNFEISIKTVKTYNDNTTLRLKNVNTDYSQNFKDAIVNTSKPVVLSRGIHSNLLTWNKFGRELAFDEKAARDTWLIEMVGGPTIDEECSPSGQYNCPNYTFSDLKTFYWPALITGVQNYSRQKTLDYVGFSLGCTVALESLKLYGSSGKTNAGYVFDSATGNYLSADLSSNPVDTFVAVACPGNFSQITTFIEAFNLTKDRRFQRYNSKNIVHIRGSDLRSDIAFFDSYYIQRNYPTLSNRIDWSVFLINGFIHPGDYKMSKNIYDEFYNWINNATGPDIGKGVSVSNLLVIQGKASTHISKLSSGIISPTEIDKNSDFIVPNRDAKDLCSNINSNNKYYLSFNGLTHGGLTTTIADEGIVRDQIKLFLKDRRIEPNERRYNFNQNCGII